MTLCSTLVLEDSSHATNDLVLSPEESLLSRHHSMANRGYRYDPLHALESQEELSDLPQETSTQPQSENHNVPIPRRRGLQKLLLASVALNAVLLMTCAWQYLKMQRYASAAQAASSGE